MAAAAFCACPPVSRLRADAQLNLNNNRVRDLTPLASCVALEKLFVAHNRVRSLKPLSPCTALTTLSVYNNRLDSVDDVVGALRRMAKVR